MARIGLIGAAMLGDVNVPVAAIPNIMEPPSSRGDGMGRLVVSPSTGTGAPGTNVAAV